MKKIVMPYIEAWVREHVGPVEEQPVQGGSRAEELARWLREDAAGSGISDAEIDLALAGSIGSGHGLVSYISDAMEALTDLAVPSPEALRLADEDV